MIQLQYELTIDYAHHRGSDSNCRPLHVPAASAHLIAPSASVSAAWNGATAAAAAAGDAAASIRRVGSGCPAAVVAPPPSFGRPPSVAAVAPSDLPTGAVAGTAAAAAAVRP